MEKPLSYYIMLIRDEYWVEGHEKREQLVHKSGPFATQLEAENDLRKCLLRHDKKFQQQPPTDPEIRI